MASHGLAALAASWTLYALAASGAGNVLLTQTAYQAGRPMITLPVIAAVTPVASAAVGIGLLGEAPGTGLAGGVAAGLAVLIASLALAFLARSAPHSEPRNHRAAGRHHGGLAILSGGGPVPVAPRSHRGAAPSSPRAFPGLAGLPCTRTPTPADHPIPGTAAMTAPDCRAAEQNGGSAR